MDVPKGVLGDQHHSERNVLPRSLCSIQQEDPYDTRHLHKDLCTSNRVGPL